MPLTTRKLISLGVFVRCFCCSSDINIKKSVFISQSKDIYMNLALEDWLYKKYDFRQQHILMLWQNEPCVVIGRHQNPWLEANMFDLPIITDQGVKFARRNSGGGTVYHDLGNLNLTFFTSKEDYNRRRNLETICRALFRDFQTKVTISPREDLTLRDYKISGTAAKLGRPNAYHHCTLLVNANKENISLVLQKKDIGIKTNATKSVKSKIMNLCDDNPKLTVESLMKSVGLEYMNKPAFTDKIKIETMQNHFQVINPTEESFPGINKIQKEFESWEWRFGKTPKFCITRYVALSQQLPKTSDTVFNFEVTIVVENGLVSNVSANVPQEMCQDRFNSFMIQLNCLNGLRYSDNVVNQLDELLGSFEATDKQTDLNFSM